LPEDEARRLPLDEIVMVVDGQMPIRVKRIQYFDDRLFKAIHAAQTGELPFPEPGGGGSQGNLPLSVRAMPMTPPANGSGVSDAVVETARQDAGSQKSGQPDAVPKRPRVSFKPLSLRNSGKWR
jgi:type IV secretion system protein VirD4